MPLPVAVLPFAPSADITANAHHDCRRRGSGCPSWRPAPWPRAALTGYPSRARDDLETVDWHAVAAPREDELAEIAW